MKVKVKCSKCGEKFYIKEQNLKEAKQSKRIYKEGSYICGKCLGYKLNPYVGILCGRYLV
ncbi:hypothetical protein [Clostridium sporogenes]|uniref:hypothetical protein n=1 Tax=Clostridium sporogenes TaxID=1509 RepID=UPI00024BA2D8|nr:hypothetical protein [Clostridium sporogenes]EHN17094.1 hypothetical protein IYC_00315 [Clostridium sporogenes PA 3679]NFQ36288.1 hypothetical protein [Clostridium sporogenes]NFQ61965.1 hypothetical protein [Clostridium sporogenes]NFU11639.1 hypothetical protein [Clostridium sporogenes]NFU45252.1 hypothetical protein [Clostridium sporogenes]